MKAGIGLMFLGLLCGIAGIMFDDWTAERVLMFGCGWNLALGFCLIIIHKMELM